MIGASNANRGNSSSSTEMAPLLQGLPLEPISLGSQRHTRSSELRRVLGIPPGSGPEDHSSGTVITKLFSPVASDGLKHFKEVVQDASRRASDRAKLFRESLFKLERCKGTMVSKKRQRNDLHINEKINSAKPGPYIQISPHDMMNSRGEERENQIGPNKRARSVFIDSQVDRSAVTPRQQVIGDRIADSQEECSGGPFRFEQKIRRLPGGGEGWDSKNKKKRSVGAMGCRNNSGDLEMKRPLNAKLSSEEKSRAGDAHGLRLKSSPSISFINRMEKSPEPTGSDATAALDRKETESALLLADKVSLPEQKILKKTANKPSLLKDQCLTSSTSVPLKSKVSRATRTSSMMLLDPSLRVTLSSQGSEDLSSTNKVLNVGMVDERKRITSSGSMSHGVAQWVGQRPHKNSRIRRSNIVAPVSSNDEARNVVQDLSVSEVNHEVVRLRSSDSPIDSGLYGTVLKSKQNFEQSGSPVGLSESEEPGSGGTKVASKGIDNEISLSATQKLGPRPFAVRKNKTPIIGSSDTLRKRRSGKTSVSGAYTQLNADNVLGTVQNMKSSSDKNKSKIGRPPPKKLSDRKSTRAFSILNNGPAEFIGDSSDDREEVMAAIKAARNAKSNACSGPFWKKVESVFTSVSTQDVLYLKRQLTYAKEVENCLSRSLSGDNMLLKKNKNDFAVEMGRLDKSVSLYQRVLSAIIEEDDTEDIFIHCDGKNMPLQYGSDDSHCGSCNFMDTDIKDRDKMEFEAESKVISYPQKGSVMDRISSNKSVSSNSLKDSSMSSSLSSNGYWLGDNEVIHSDVWLLGEICSNDATQSYRCGIGSTEKSYQSLSLDDRIVLELQSIGIYPEPLPDLLEGEVIAQEINELRGALPLQVAKKRRNLEKLIKNLTSGTNLDKRKIEQDAMDQLIEIAYKKRLACRESNSSKASLRKMSKQVALAFIKRTLARCRRFENAGTFFKEPALQDLIHNDTKSTDCVASNLCQENTDAKSGAMFSHEKFKRREVMIDEVIGSASSRFTSNPNFGNEGEKDQRQVNTRSISAVCSPSEPKSESKPKIKAMLRGSHIPSDSFPSTSSNGAMNIGIAGCLPKVTPLHGIIKEGDESIELQMTELESFGLEPDFFSNIDDDGHDTMGLEIPMDDLSDLHLVF